MVPHAQQAAAAPSAPSSSQKNGMQSRHNVVPVDPNNIELNEMTAVGPLDGCAAMRARDRAPRSQAALAAHSQVDRPWRLAHTCCCRRYGKATLPFRKTFSEYGLIRFRVLVECRWLQKLSQIPQVRSAACSASTRAGITIVHSHNTP